MDAEECHFKKVVRSQDVKVWVCHTTSYCKRMNLSCNSCTDADLSSYHISSMKLIGDNNTLSILESATKSASFFEIIVSGKKNTIHVDTGKLASSRLQHLVINVVGHSMLHEDVSMKLKGVVEKLTITTSRHLRLDAGELKITHEAQISSEEPNLIKTLVEPKCTELVTWSIVEKTSNVVVPHNSLPCISSSRNKSKCTSSKRKKKCTKISSFSVSDKITYSEKQKLSPCPICRQNVPNAICYPCGHMLCFSCVTFLESKVCEMLCCPHAGCNRSIKRVFRAILQLQMSNGNSFSESKVNDEAIIIE